MKRVTIEYIAGFVDSKGRFTIRRRPANCYCPVFVVNSVNLDVLRSIRKFFALRLKITTLHTEYPKPMTTYRLQVQKIDKVKSIAALLHPHLRLKKAQAEIIMEYPRAHAKHTKYGCEADKATKVIHEKLRNQILYLNKRGQSTQEPNEDPELKPDPQLGLLKHKGGD